MATSVKISEEREESLRDVSPSTAPLTVSFPSARRRLGWALLQQKEEDQIHGTQNRKNKRAVRSAGIS